MQTGKIGKRIKEVRKSEGLTQTEFGEKIGVKGNTITGYENGTRNPSDSIINYICLLFDVNQTWLRTGEGEMHVSIPDSKSALERLFCNQECNNLEIKFLTAYFGLTKKERKAFCELLVKMFPDAIPQITGAAPLSSPYEAGFQEAPPLSGSTTEEPVAGTPSSVAEAESLYESSSGFVPPTGSSASNTTEGTDTTDGTKTG